MNFIINKSFLKGEVDIPGSKSHTIRALVFALLADGKSIIKRPLDSSDTRSCLSMIEQFGAKIEIKDNEWIIYGKGKDLQLPDNIIDVANSGTTLYIGLGIAAIIKGYTVFTGDSQIRNRPADVLINAINDLGGEAFSSKGNDMPPIIIKGPISGGHTEIEAVSSQYLTSLLIAAPLLKGDSHISIKLLNELPYVTMTLNWLDKIGIEYKNNDYKEFFVKGKQEYKPFSEYIAADFSTATFFLVAAVITGSELLLKGLDFTDSQGDKEVVNILKKMGADITLGKKYIKIKGGELKGGEFDLNAIPDSLPALSVAGCFASGETKLYNVKQARLKETDRISVMFNELSKLGADITEMDDGLIIRKSNLKGGSVNGHDDHRVVMALSILGFAIDEEISVSTAESVAVTFPEFKQLMNNLGGNIITGEN
jgi:3-phosphoshikimate 1-carboxyvinyltransferase